MHACMYVYSTTHLFLACLLLANVRSNRSMCLSKVYCDQCPLPQVSMQCVLSALRANPSEQRLVPSLVRLLASRHQLTPEPSLDKATVSALLTSCVHTLSVSASGSNLLSLCTALNYCALVRH